MDLSNSEKIEIISIKIIKLKAHKESLMQLLSEYLLSDPGYPESLLNEKIYDIENQVQVLTNMLEML